MQMTNRAVTYFAALIGAAFATTPGHGGEPRAVIELFTSQGCSSCPPADRLLGELARDPTLVTMTLPVDYWDYLGWKDTLAQHGHTNRQRAYSQARGDREVFTPQVIVNGVLHVLGSDKAAIERAIAQSRDGAVKPLVLPVAIEIADGKITVNVAAGAAQGRDAEIWLCPITASAPVTVKRGENGGHTIVYSNVVRSWRKLGPWTGKAETFTIPLSDLSATGHVPGDIDRIAVVVQSGVAAKPGAMLGAAQANLR
jgi:hypothetical protein